MKYFIAISFSLLFISCETKVQDQDPNDPIMAAVFDQQLKYSDIAPLLQTETSIADSTQYAHAVIEKWVRDAVFMHEAESNIPEDLDIEKMVDDYRSSLIVLNYKQKLVHQKLDTFVSQEQLEAYYETHSTQYKLDEPILQCMFLKVKDQTPFYEEVDKLWRSKNYEEIAVMDQSQFEILLQEGDGWYTWKNVKALIPGNFWPFGNIKSKDPRSKTSGDYKYYIKVFDYEDKNKIAPLSYIEDQAKKVILHKRQTELIDNLMEDLYVKYSNNKNVKINI